jgi:Chromo (CHRromatin Organisation MOdifier) domain
MAKWAIFIAGREDWKAPEWAERFWMRVVNRWGLSKEIISDRGSVFTSEFWQYIFQKAGTRLLYSTAWHPQTDGQSEAMNQILQTTLRYFVNERQDDWAYYLTDVEFVVNNSNSSSTGKSPNEILYGFRLRSPISRVGEHLTEETSKESIAFKRQTACDEAQDAMKYAAYHMARYYNDKHEHKEFKEGECVYLRLGHGYNLRGIPKAKFALQRVGPFKILQRIGTHAYKLQLPDNWGIQDVISVSQLEPAPQNDPYNREVPPPPPIDVDGEEEYEIETIIASRMRGRPRRNHHLVRWKGWGAEYGDWIAEENLEHAGELIEEFKQREKEKLRIEVR